MRWGRRWLVVVVAMAACSRGPAGLRHTVQRGESLYRIGQAYGVSHTTLARVNRIDDPNSVWRKRETRQYRRDHEYCRGRRRLGGRSESKSMGFRANHPVWLGMSLLLSPAVAAHSVPAVLISVPSNCFGTKRDFRQMQSVGCTDHREAPFDRAQDRPFD